MPGPWNDSLNKLLKILLRNVVDFGGDLCYNNYRKLRKGGKTDGRENKSSWIWQNDNSFKTLEEALEYCDNDLYKYELMRIIPQYFGKGFQEEPKEWY